jgi:hypothetical protein
MPAKRVHVASAHFSTNMKELITKKYILAANGEWQTILSDLKGVSAFEINGYSQGEPTKGRYCVIHAIALNGYTGKRGRIYCKNNYYGWWWQRLKLRWIGIPHNYELQIKTCSNYGLKGRIIIYVKSLLNDEFESGD